jgi:tetratricopeptide (TPR) repeat protein
MSGQTDAYSLGNLELIPTWMYWKSPHFFTIAIALLGPAAAACVANVRRVPVSHWMWLAATAGLAMLARRNVCLTGPVCGYLLAVHGGQLLRRIAWAKRGTGTSAAKQPASSEPVPLSVMNPAALLLALAFAAGCATEVLFRWQGFGRRFGARLYRPHYPIDIAEHLGSLEAPGDIFCANWADASVFMHFSRPRLLWMDGRLEAHTLERFLSQQKITAALDKPAAAGSIGLPPKVRFFYVPNTYRKALSSMARSRRFRLLRVDEVGVCFERVDYPQRPDFPLPPGDNLGDFDRPLLASGQIEGLPANARRWWRQNPPSRHRPIANAMLWLAWRPLNERPDARDGLADRAGLLAIRYLEAMRVEGICEPTSAVGLLAQAYHQRSRRVDHVPTDAAPIDLLSARALYLYGRLNLDRLDVEDIRSIAEQHVDALVRARRLDAAVVAAERMLDLAPRDLPPWKLQTWRRLRASLRAAATAGAARAKPLPADAVERARLLASPSVGMADEAIAALRATSAASRTPQAWLLLGDLLLNAGRPGEAREAYARAGPNATWRLVLCDWVEDPLTGGDMPAAAPPAARAYERTRRAILGRPL